MHRNQYNISYRSLYANASSITPFDTIDNTHTIHCTLNAFFIIISVFTYSTKLKKTRAIDNSHRNYIDSTFSSFHPTIIIIVNYDSIAFAPFCISTSMSLLNPAPRTAPTHSCCCHLVVHLVVLIEGRQKRCILRGTLAQAAAHRQHSRQSCPVDSSQTRVHNSSCCTCHK